MQQRFLAAVLAISACGGETSPGVGPATPSVRANRVLSPSATAPAPCDAMSKFGPNAVYVAAGSRACQFYDRIFAPREEAHPNNNMWSEKNLVATDPGRVPPRWPGRRNQRSGPPLQPGTGDAGWFVNDFLSQWGPGSEEVVQLNLEIPSNLADVAPPDTGAVIYAPTNKPEGACLELTVIYWRLPGAATTTRELGWYDWCQTPARWQTMEDMNAPGWANTYTGAGYWPPEGQDETQIYWGLDSVAGNNCWQGVLFNMVGGYYEQKAYSCGTPGTQSGWSMWESYFVMDYLTDPSQCPTIPRVDASIATNKGWLDQVSLSPLGPYGLCWTSGFYYLDWYIYPGGGAHTWRAHTP